MARRNRREEKANPPKNGGKKRPRSQDFEKKESFRETPLTHRGAGRLRAQLRGVTVERCSDKGILGRECGTGIYVSHGGSVELTGCSLRGNATDYQNGYRGRHKGTITADGRRVG